MTEAIRLRNHYGAFDKDKSELLRTTDEKIRQALEFLVDAGIDHSDAELYIIQEVTCYGATLRLQQGMAALKADRHRKVT